MNTKDLVGRSKRVSWLLRHGAASEGLEMDGAGWVAIADVLRTLHLSRAALDEVVAQNDKKRFEVAGDSIRAVQGHSTAGTAVELDALEASWTVHTGDEPVWHGTHLEALPAIAREGLRSQRRSHVHLAPSTVSRVGKRSAVHVMLEVSPAALRAAGHTLFRSPNGVLLAREVPRPAIVGLLPMTRAARAREAELRALFDLADPCGATSGPPNC